MVTLRTMPPSTASYAYEFREIECYRKGKLDYNASYVRVCMIYMKIYE